MPSESELDEIARLLVEGPEGDESQAGEDQPPESPPDTQEATAEQAETGEDQDEAGSEQAADKSLTEAFYAQQVPGTEMTYGDFKDRVKELAAFETDRAAFEAEQSEFRNERLKYAREQQLLQAAGKAPQLSEAERQQAEQQLTAYQAQQAELTRRAIPAWTDQAVLMRDFEDIAGDLGRYGYAKGEVQQWIENDARFAKFAHDVLTERRALEAAKAKVKVSNGKAKAPTRTESVSQKQRLAAMASDSTLTKEDRALAALLGG